MKTDKGYYTDESDGFIQCPYCGNKITIDDESHYDQSGTVEECNECGKSFDLSPDCSWSWHTEKNCELNTCEHSWIFEGDEHLGKEFKDSGKFYGECINCKKREFVKK